MSRIKGFTAYEARALRSLVGKTLGPTTVERLARDATLASVERHSQGYRLIANHSLVLSERVVCDSPLVLGRYENTTVRFTALVECDLICLDCLSVDGSDVPEYLRERDVSVKHA